MSTDGQRVTVKYEAWQGIVGERIIRDNEWKAIGIDFKTVSFNTSNGFRQDASDWPSDVMDYFENQDDEFKVFRNEAAGAEDPVEAPSVVEDGSESSPGVTGPESE